MKFLSKWPRRRKAHADGLRYFAPLDPKAQEDLARDVKFYEIDDLAVLDASSLMKSLMIHRHHRIYAQLNSLGKKYSMLHPDLLTMLYYLAKHADGNVLEIGPFLGGSTMATAIGLRERSRPPTFVTVEKGGERTHSRLGTCDIVRDLKQNLRENGLAHLVQVVVGFSLGKKTAEAVRAHLAPRSVTLLIADADGEVRSLLDLYHELLGDHCWLVIDDYFATGPATAKSAKTKPQVDEAMATGELEEMGFYGWGTWVGKWHRAGHE
jgi:predicted O-methyltransferase YrrM